jgi:hypothetical protein
MTEMSLWFRFVLAVLATWRVTHLLAHEDGPGDILFRARAWLGSSPVGKLMDCFFCLSFWVAAPLALILARELLDWALTWLALSGAACLLQRVMPEPQPPVVIHQLPEEGRDPPYAMLRTETRQPEDEDTPPRHQ